MSIVVSDEKGDQYLQALGKEIMKVKRVYDGSNRVITQYEAYANAADGAPCLQTTYTYIGAATQIDKMLEAIGVWSAAYDI